MTQPNDSPPLVDTHTHLDEPVFDLDREAVLAASRHAGVRRFINIGYKPERWDTSRSLREQHRDIEVVIGLHPLESASFGPELQRQLLGEVEDLRPVAIGEAGFDFVRAAPSAQEQERAFRVQLEIASHTGLPVVIHQREAADALM
ncbi:MAG: TatD family hydrolase, partial [Thermomicrobiales bacterium]